MKQKIPKSQRADNAFVKQIFDKTTGKPLMCRLHQDDTSYQTFSNGWWDKERISYDVVMEQAVAALRRERDQASHVLKRLDAGDGEAEKEQRKQPLAERMRQLSQQVAQLSRQQLSLSRMWEKGELSEEDYEAHRAEVSAQLAEKESHISELMERADKLETAFSSRNPWIQLYANLDVPERLGKAQVRKWIDRVLICNMETVEIVFPEAYIYWKKQLPKEWFRKNGFEGMALKE